VSAIFRVIKCIWFRLQRVRAIAPRLSSEAISRFKEQILEFERLITAWHRPNEMSMRLDEAPSVGPVLATAVVATRRPFGLRFLL
jgi:transposase